MEEVAREDTECPESNLQPLRKSDGLEAPRGCPGGRVLSEDKALEVLSGHFLLQESRVPPLRGVGGGHRERPRPGSCSEDSRGAGRPLTLANGPSPGDLCCPRPLAAPAWGQAVIRLRRLLAKFKVFLESRDPADQSSALLGGLRSPLDSPPVPWEDPLPFWKGAAARGWQGFPGHAARSAGTP